MSISLTPREIVSELDRFIIGQKDAKRAVAVALRNRWRRLQLGEDIREEILPKNILMIGPTGVGKTEIARRLAKLVDAPFIKIEATKFTEVGYVGRDVEQIIRDLVETAIATTKEQNRKDVVVRAEGNAENRVLDALVGAGASDETREKFRKKLRDGLLGEKEIEIEVNDQSSMQLPTIDVPGMPGAQMGMLNLGDIFGKAFGKTTKMRKMTVADSHRILLEENGIVFLDEIDKICASSQRQGADVSREGVQRDLLPLIEGTAVTTKYGMVRTDHILFIASGAFHIAKPSDLLPELQGRLPNRVELKALTQDDFCRILTEPEFSLIKQYQALMSAEDLNLVFTPESISEIARLAADINQNIENIGARRLQTVLEKLLEEISFNASDHPGETMEISPEMVRTTVETLAKNTDIAKFVL